MICQGLSIINPFLVACLPMWVLGHCGFDCNFINCMTDKNHDESLQIKIDLHTLSRRVMKIHKQVPDKIPERKKPPGSRSPESRLGQTLLSPTLPLTIKQKSKYTIPLGNKHQHRIKLNFYKSKKNIQLCPSIYNVYREINWSPYSI